MWAHPGKQLLFMGGEFGQEREWSHDDQLDWWIPEQFESHRRLQSMVQSLNEVYRAAPAFWVGDSDPAGFQWIDANDAEQSVLSFLRRRPGGPDREVAACVANLTPMPRYGYRVGLPVAGRWSEVLNTDAIEWGGSGVGNCGAVEATDTAWHGQPASVPLTLPPLGVLWLVPG
jgi:1,4-alpha-glucan branching enzyme